MHHAGYVQGLLLYSYLTGEPIGIAGAEGIAQWVLRNMSPAANVGMMERALGHALMTLTDVYEATGDDPYLRGAARLVDWALKWEHPYRGGFRAPITEAPGFYSGSPFCGGILTAGLLKFNSWGQLPEIDRLLERAARWTLTDVWRPPAGLQGKGGSPRNRASPHHIANHLRLMAHAYDRTRDPLFLVVPRQALAAGFGEGARPFGTRATGLVYNYLPWFVTTCTVNGDPQPDTQLEVQAKLEEVTVARGGKARLGFTVKNAGDAPVRGWKISCHTRLDFQVTPERPAPEVLEPGQIVELWYTLQAPEWLNLTCEYNRATYAHWSALYQREGKTYLTHRWAKISVEK